MTIRNIHALIETLSENIVPVDILWGRYYQGGKPSEIHHVFVSDKNGAPSFLRAVEGHISKISDKKTFSEKERMNLIIVERDSQSIPLLWLDAPDRKKGGHVFIAIPLTIRCSKNFLETFIWLESVMDNASSLCCLIDSNGNFLRLSRKGCEILGVDQENIRNRNFEEFLISPDRISELAILSQRNDNTEFYLRNGKGEEILYIGSIVPFFDRNDDVLYYYIIVTDFSRQMHMVTDTMKNNMELANMNDFLKRSQTTLLKAEKLSSIGMLGSGLAHEINNPLSFIINDIQLLGEFCDNFGTFTARLNGLRDKVPEIEGIYKAYDMDYYVKEVPEMLCEMREGMGRIQKIIGSLKSFSGLESGDDWNYADVNALLEEMLIISRNEYKYNVDLDLLPGEVPHVYCHLKELNQAFLSVFLNSIQAVQERWSGQGEKGKIIIKTEYVGSDDSVRIIFIDNGSPFPDSMHERLLDPFYTHWKNKGGSGLGLALVNDIISHKHKGDVDFEEADEKKVILTIPVNIKEIQGV